MNQRTWFFVSDLHGRVDRYRKLFEAVARECPEAVLLGGDLLPSAYALALQLQAAAEAESHAERSARPAAVRSLGPFPQGDPVRDEDGHGFVRAFLAPGFARLRDSLRDDYPPVFLILGNDDPRAEEEALLELSAAGLWQYLHGRRAVCHGTAVFGYAYVPPTPFLLKDWERYDVSRYVDPGCASPEEGWRSVPVSPTEARYATIKEDLDNLAGNERIDDTVWLFHAPPHHTHLDRAALDGVMIDHAPLDVHVGSIAIRRFIEAREPLVTLHGHIHESARLTGHWQQRIGRTLALSAAHDGPELALVRFDPANPGEATRENI